MLLTYHSQYIKYNSALNVELSPVSRCMYCVIKGDNLVDVTISSMRFYGLYPVSILTFYLGEGVFVGI